MIAVFDFQLVVSLVPVLNCFNDKDVEENTVSDTENTSERDLIHIVEVEQRGFVGIWRDLLVFN